MSGELDIRGGGAVAVDTETLRAAAAGFAGLALELEEIAESVGSSSLRIMAASREAAEASYAVFAVSRRIDEAAEQARALAASLRAAAAVYEIVELRAERAAAEALGDGAALTRIDARLARLIAEHPDAEHHATVSMAGHWLTWPGELARQAAGALWWLMPGSHMLAAPAAWALQRAVGATGAGTVPHTSRLRGEGGRVIVTALPAATPVLAAPATLVAAVARIPREGEARIRVERYTMTDGSARFAVYVAGTRAAGSGAAEPFDMRSNAQLYTGRSSASFEATMSALRHAGAEADDVVHVFGHSQGAMVAAHVALEGGFDTQTLVALGSPVEADVGAGTLSVTLRHRDDPVAALAAGGHAGGVGAPGSFLAERVVDPASGVHDLRMPAHSLDAYTETARLLDGSDDARMAAVRRVFDELGAAASVEVTEYAATRVLPLPQPQPGLAPQPPVSPGASGAG